MSGKALALLIVTLTAAVSAPTAISRNPTRGERGALDQAVFDEFFKDGSISHYRVVSETVVALSHPGAVKNRLASKYANVWLKGWDTAGEFVGDVQIVAVYFSSPQPGWTVFALGTGNTIGCAPSWFPSGQELHVGKQLGLHCTSS